MKCAEIEVLWIAENEPDLFSRCIMWFLNRPYSHNAIIYKKTGMMWHATTPGGVCETSPALEMKGCHVAASISIVLGCTEEHFEGFLSGEDGKGYDHWENISQLCEHIPLIGGPLASLINRKGRNQSRNCSEFVANIIHRYHQALNPKVRWTPAYTERILKPRRLV